MSRGPSHAILGTFLTVLVACTPATVGGPSPAGGNGVPGLLRVAAASDLRFAMDDLAADWKAAHPEIEISVTYGSSGTLFSQISEGAPYDIFFSADAELPRRLEDAGRAPNGATRPYATGQLCLWVRSESSLDVSSRGLSALTDASVAAVAIANPEHAPYGRAAVAALQTAGVYDLVEARLVLGENVSQAAQFVESGAADAGIIALSLALSPPLAESGRHWLVPLDFYPRLEQGALVMGSAADAVAANTFLDFVLGLEGQAVLDRHGFLPPP